MSRNEDGTWNQNPQYNKSRGGTEKHGSYIKDRVDLTLLEIKNYIDNKESYEDKYQDQILYSQIKNKDSNMKAWLDHFNTFDVFIDFFEFSMFMSEGCQKKINMLSGKDTNIYKMDKEKIELMLEDLVRRIRLRTRKMEEKLKLKHCEY